MRKLFLLIVLWDLHSHAQSPMSVQEAVATALRNNYDLQLVRSDSAAYSLDYGYANYAFLPQLSGFAAKTWNNNDQKQEFTDGTKRERDNVKSSNFQASVNLNWTLFDGLRMFATRTRLQELVLLGELTVKNQIVNTVASVLTTYYNIIRQQQQLRAIEEQISVDEERVRLADRKLSVGLGTKPELLQARVDLNAQQAARLNQLKLIAQLKEQLNQLTGRPLGDYFEVSDTIPLNLDLELGTITENLEQTSPALLLAQKNIDIANLTLRERKAELWPTISFNSAYNFSRINNVAVVNPFQPLFSQNRGFTYGFTANIPILSGFNTRRLIRQAQLDIQYQQIVFENQRSLVRVDIANAYEDYQYQKRALLLEEENINLARENLMIALERFRQGVSTNLELREAQRSLEEAYNRLIAARYNTKLAEIELLRLQGRLVEATIN